MKRKGTHNRPLDQRVVSETPIAISYTECVALKKVPGVLSKKKQHARDIPCCVSCKYSKIENLKFQYQATQKKIPVLTNQDTH